MPAPTASVILLGCPKNQVDAEHILGTLRAAGWDIIPEPGAADAVVITTCAFLQSAVRESEGVIADTLKLKLANPAMRVVVAGCLVERGGAGLARRFPGVDYWVGISELTGIPSLLAGRRPGLATAPCALPGARTPRLLSTPGHYAYLRIADGCENRCSYCAIPGIRGAVRSRPVPDVIAEARALARSGVKELVIIAQDTTRYGQDSYRRPALTRLLGLLGRIRGIRWLRLMYAHPARINGALIRQFEHNPKLCRYLDLPLQHINDAVLRRMNRPYGRAQIEQLLARLRRIPGLRLRTTLLVGFPGETRARFDELLGFVRTARIERLSAYAWSPEPGTPAFRFPGRVTRAEKSRRVRELMLAQARVSRARLRELVGRRITVLVDEPGIGRTEWDAPEVDGVVRLTGPRVEPGRFVRAIVTGSSTHDLVARVLRP